MDNYERELLTLYYVTKDEQLQKAYESKPSGNWKQIIKDGKKVG